MGFAVVAALDSAAPFRNFLAGVSNTGALASHRSRDARALDSRKGTSCLEDGWRTGAFDGCLDSPSGEVRAAFLPSHQVDKEAEAAFPMESHREEALVLVDLAEDESDAGEEFPEEVVEYTEGLSGRTEDTEIQSCSIGSLSQLLQSPPDVNSLRGPWDFRGFRTMSMAAGANELVRKTDLGMEILKRPKLATLATCAGGLHRASKEETVGSVLNSPDLLIHSVGFPEFST
jgi:hypothetical protein